MACVGIPAHKRLTQTSISLLAASRLLTHGAFPPRARLQMDSEDGATQHFGMKKLVNEGIKTSMAVIGRGYSSFLRPETHPELKTNY